MDKVVKTLKVCFFAPIVIALILVVLYETEVMIPGFNGFSTQAWFIILTVMELLTIAVIPAALYLFKNKKVKEALKAEPVAAMKKYGVMRLLMLGLPLVANTDLYYMSMNVAFGYMAIILLLVRPSFILVRRGVRRRGASPPNPLSKGLGDEGTVAR
jgi:hypothetical protein